MSDKPSFCRVTEIGLLVDVSYKAAKRKPALQFGDKLNSVEHLDYQGY